MVALLSKVDKLNCIYVLLHLNIYLFNILLNIWNYIKENKNIVI